MPKRGMMSVRLERKHLFIRELAEYLAGNQAEKSVRLEMGQPGAKEWAALRAASPLFGWPTVDEAEHALWEFFG